MSFNSRFQFDDRHDSRQLWHCPWQINSNSGHKQQTSMISKFHRVLNAVYFLLGDSPASEFYMPTFRNYLFHLLRQVGLHAPTCLWRWNGQCSETSAYKIQTRLESPKRKHTTDFEFHNTSVNISVKLYQISILNPIIRILKVKNVKFALEQATKV